MLFEKNKNALTLSSLGNRIAIIGCSSSGKSTLADRLSTELKIPVFHLDFYAHQHNSNWIRVSDADLIEQHKKILHNNAWIIEGNYSVCMDERLDLATTVIWIDPNVWGAAWRFTFRNFNKSNRVGKLPGAKTDFSWAMVKWILFNYPKNRSNYIIKIQNRPNLNVIHLQTLKQLDELQYLLFNMSNSNPYS